MSNPYNPAVPLVGKISRNAARGIYNARYKNAANTIYWVLWGENRHIPAKNLTGKDWLVLIVVLLFSGKLTQQVFAGLSEIF